MRTQETMRKEFITKPGDIFTIKGISNCISDSLTINIKNGIEDFTITMRNFLPAWKLLKQLDEMGGRSVFNQIDNNEPEPFKESLPYTCRFGVNT